ncbi:MAG: hypothetical protein WC867_00735 [Candidatus Pacearchaeota archaeon]|jgi:hypothetical protein
MKGLLVQSTLYGKRELNKIVRTRELKGHSSKIKAIGTQLPIYKDRPLSYCSFFCNGYDQVYGNREGVIFETDSPVIYACPVDVFHLIRGGIWLPGYERFIFPTIDKMIEKYPNLGIFKKDFSEYFRNLKPEEVYPDNTRNFAIQEFEFDYCLRDWNPGCNEVTFDKPTKINNVRIYSSVDELKNILEIKN